jgi:hypothetical protein
MMSARSCLLPAVLALLACDASAAAFQPTNPFELTPEDAFRQALGGCQAVIGGADPAAVFSALAPLDPPAPVVRENNSPAIQDLVTFFGDGRMVRSGVAPLAGLIVVVTEEGDLCQAISMAGPEMALAASRAISASDWRWTGTGRADRPGGQAVEILDRPASPGSVAHVVVRFRRG